MKLKRCSVIITPRVREWRNKQSAFNSRVSKGFLTAMILPHMLIDILSAKNSQDFYPHTLKDVGIEWKDAEKYLNFGYCESDTLQKFFRKAARMEAIVESSIDHNFLSLEIRFFEKGKVALFSLEFHIEKLSGAVYCYGSTTLQGS